MQGLQKLLLEGQEPDAVFLSHKLEIKGDRPPARYGHGIVPVIVEGKAALVLFGGIDKEGNYREEVDAFDTAKLQWTQLTNSLETRRIHLAPPPLPLEPVKAQYPPKIDSDDNGTQGNGTGRSPRPRSKKKKHKEPSSTQKLKISGVLSFKDLQVHSASQWQASKKVGQEGNEALGRVCHTMVVYGDSMYVFGGNNKFFLNDLWKFDFDTLLWTKLENCTSDPNKPCRRMGHTAVVYKEHMWVFGGFSNDAESLNDLWKYNFEKSEWTKVEYQGEVGSRYEHTADVVGDSMYILGGKGNFTAAPDQFLKYDFVTNTWYPQDNNTCPSPRWGHASASNSKAIYVYGGFGEEKGYANDCYEYMPDAGTGRWRKVEVQRDAGFAPSARQLHTFIFVGTRGYVMGGIGADGVLDDMLELWDLNERIESTGI